MLDAAPARSAHPWTYPPAPVRRAGIRSVAIELPEGRITNAQLGERFGVSEDWILSRTGIRERCQAAPDDRVSDYAIRAATKALERADLGLQDIDLFVYHQANARITRTLGQRPGLPAERVVDCIEHYGNASAATIPLALTVALEDGRLREGANVLLCAFGSGFTWGAGVVRWGTVHA